MSFRAIWLWLQQWPARRDERKYQQWCAFLQTRESGAEIFQIVGIRASYPRKGVKAYGQWLDGQQCALWIEKAWPSVGVFMSASGSRGGGPHHGEEVFYAKQPYYFIDGKYYRAMRRHVARMNKSAASV